MRISDGSSDVCSSDLPTALVVGPDNKVELRPLSTGRTQGSNWIVNSGLKPGDKVIVAGVQKVRPGMTVKPVEQPPAPDARSEEHTSELQSLMRISYAVFCLKKKIQKETTQNATSKTTLSPQ